eukprot:Awhi_evm2s14535
MYKVSTGDCEMLLCDDDVFKWSNYSGESDIYLYAEHTVSPPLGTTNFYTQYK